MSLRQALLITAALCLAGGRIGQAQLPPITILIPTAHPNATQPSTGTATGPTGSTTLFVIGTVVTADGGELPPNVVIAKVCGNKREALGFVGHKGTFSVKLNASSLATLLDASDDNRGEIGRMSTSARDQGGVNLMGCELLASFPGYRSDKINISTRRSLDSPDIGTIILRRLGEGSGTMVSETMLTAPKGALKAFNAGVAHLRKGEVDQARKSFDRSVAMDPQLAGGWYELGDLQMNSDPVAAKACLEKAIAADPKYALPYADLTLLAYRKENWDETLRLSEIGLKLDSAGSPSLYFFNAATHLRLAHFEEAEKKARAALRVDFGHTLPRAPELLGYILEARHDYTGAAEQLRAYLASEPPDAERVRAELSRIAAMSSIQR